VHHALAHRLPGEVIRFGHRQGIHVGAQAHHAAAGVAAPADDRDYTGAPHARVDLIDTAHAQRLLHAGGGVHLLEAQFGVGVQVAAQRREFGVELRDVREGPSVGLQT
jgi:hypothetical protein